MYRQTERVRERPIEAAKDVVSYSFNPFESIHLIQHYDELNFFFLIENGRTEILIILYEPNHHHHHHREQAFTSILFVLETENIYIMNK